MTREQIKNLMISNINENLQAELEELDIPSLINEEMVLDFLWGKSFGARIVKEYIDEHEDDIIEGYLEEIYDEIDIDDLEMPW